MPSVLFDLPLNANGRVLPALASTDLHLVADDLTPGSDWVSRVPRAGGGAAWVFTPTGTPTVGAETPFYPNGGFAGTGYRTGVKGWSTSDYYSTPVHEDHIVRASQTLSWEFIVNYPTALDPAIGGGTRNVFGRHSSAGGSRNHVLFCFTNYTFAFWLYNTGGSAAWLSVATSAVSYGSWQYYAFTLNGPATTLVGYQGGVVVQTSSTPNGTLQENDVVAMVIGTSSSPGSSTPSDPTFQIVEILRHREVLSAATIAARHAYFAGVLGGAGEVPTFTRATVATALVNSKLWSFAHRHPRLNATGYHAETTRTQRLINSTATEDALTSWTATGTTITRDATDADVFAEVGGAAFKFASDATPTLNSLGQTAASITVNTTYALSFDWKAAGAGQALFYQVQNPTTGRYLRENSFTARDSQFGSANTVVDLVYGAGQWLAAGLGGNVSTSPDGITWTARTSGFGSTNIRHAAYNGVNLWAIGGVGGLLSTSPDGITWTPRTSQFSTSNVEGIAHDQSGLWVAVGGGGKISTSPDGITWTARTSGTASVFYNVAHGNGLWVAVGQAGIVFTSPNGITWTARTSNFGSGDVRGVHYANNLWVAVGGLGGKIITSADGITWALVQPGPNVLLLDVFFGAATWVAAGTNGTLLTSADGITWVVRLLDPPGTTVDNYSIAHDGVSQWALGGVNGALYTAATPEGTWSDSVTWNAFPASMTQVRSERLLRSEPSGTTLTVAFGNGGDAANADGTLYVYHAQLEAGAEASSRIVARTAQLQRAGDVLTYTESEVINTAAGKASAVVTPTQVSTAYSILYGSTGYVMRQNLSSDYRSNDSTTVVSQATVPVVGVANTVSTEWRGNTQSISVDGVTSSSGFDGSMGAGNITVGVNSFVKNVRITRNADPPRILLDLPLNANGRVLPALATTDLHLVADDLTPGSDWVSRVPRAGGGAAWVFTPTGTPTVGAETPFYPAGGFAGTGYRKGVKGWSASNYYVGDAHADHVLHAGESMTWEFVVRSPPVRNIGTTSIAYGVAGATVPPRNAMLLYTNTVWAFYTYNTAGAVWLQGSISLTPPVGGGFVYMCAVYDGANNTITMYHGNTVYGTVSNPVGTLNEPTTIPLCVGAAASGYLPCDTATQIIEIARHRAALSAATIAYRSAHFMGLLGGAGEVPSVYTRAGTTATIVVNGKLWMIGLHNPRLNATGYHAETARTQRLINSTATEADLTSWTATGTTITRDATDADVFAEVGGAAFKFVSDATPTLNSLGQTAASITVNTTYALSFDWKAAGAGQALFYQAQNPTTGRYLRENSFTARDSQFGSGAIVNSAAYGIGQWMIAGQTGKVSTSPDGITWTASTTGTTVNLRAIGHNGADLWAFAGPTGVLRTSPDGITWTARTSQFTAGETIEGLFHNKSNLWVASGTGGKVTTSPDGIAWTVRTSGVSAVLYAVGFGNALWVVAGAAGTLITSTDGITWTPRTSQFGSSDIYDVHYANSLWMAVGASGKVATSTDGITWTLRTSNVSVSLRKVDFGGAVWAVAGDSDTLVTSADGITWATRLPSGVTSAPSWTALAYDGVALWVLAGSRGILGTASIPEGIWSDSVTWNAFPASMTQVRSERLLRSEPSGTTLTVAFGNGGDAANADGTLYVYHAQLEAGTEASSRIVARTAQTTRNADVLTYTESEVVNTAAGKASAIVTPTQVSAAVNVIAGTTGYLVNQNAATAYRSNDSTTVVSQATAPVVGVANTVSTEWYVTTQKITVDGIATSGSFDGSMGAGNITVGVNSFVKDVKITE